jgi:hypothetical protein
MRLLIGLAAAALLGMTAAPVDAQQKKYRNYDYDRYERYDRYDREWRDHWFFDLFPGYQSRNPDNFRHGSREWWRAMDLEGRGGHPRL